MGSSRSTSQGLFRILDAVSQPVCLVGEQRKVVYLNAAGADWLGVAANDVVGRACRYQSGDQDPIAAAADALCPPPKAFLGERTAGVIVKPNGGQMREITRPPRRNAEYIPLLASDGLAAGVLVILANEDLAADAHSSVEANDAPMNEARQLHEAVAQFHRDMHQWHHPSRLAGRSPTMAQVRAQVKLAASGAGSVLIVGPPGIGRQHVARTIHAASATKSSLLPISCSVLTADLLRSTLTTVFGRRASAGEKPLSTVLFLDAHQLPAELQPELIDRLTNCGAGIRIMATATKRLDLLAERGEFRGDLASLLSTLVIELPLLSSRPDDIPLLAQAFLEDLNAQGSRQLSGFAADAMDHLVAYGWPGETDELANVVGESAVHAEDTEVRVVDLPKRLHHAAQAARYPRHRPEPIQLETFLDSIEKQLIERAMQEANDNKAQAARLLGLTRPSLYRRMLRLGLASNDDSLDSPSPTTIKDADQ